MSSTQIFPTLSAAGKGKATVRIGGPLAVLATAAAAVFISSGPAVAGDSATAAPVPFIGYYSGVLDPPHGPHRKP